MKKYLYIFLCDVSEGEDGFYADYFQADSWDEAKKLFVKEHSKEDEVEYTYADFIETIYQVMVIEEGRIVDNFFIIN